MIEIPIGVYERKKHYLYQCPAWLFCNYLLLEKTTTEMAAQVNTNHKNILYWLKKYKINRRLGGRKKGSKLSKEHKQKISESHKGDKHPMWKGGIRKTRNFYTRIFFPNHPNAHKDGYIKEHRLIMEKHLGRYLTSEERVHHINGIKDDNRIENLMLFENETEHQKYHNRLN